MESKMKRILVYGMTNNPGGIESYLMGMLYKIKKYNVQFDFITDFDSMAYYDEAVKNGARVYFIPAKGKGLFKHWKKIADVLKEHPEYDTVYFNILDAGAVFSILIPWIMRKKIIVHSHNGSTEKVKLHKMCRPILNRLTNCYAACSNLAAKYMFGDSICEKKNVLIIPNAIDTEKFDIDIETRNKYRKKLGIESAFVICHIGRMSEQKNPLRMIDIFDEVYKKDNTARLLYIGEGELHAEVYSYVKNKESKDAVNFLGIRHDIPALLQCSDMFFLPSLYEGLPIVAVEAQASGLPCILSTAITKEVDITGNVEFVDLDQGDSVWAEKILEKKKNERKSCKKKVTDAGYDKSTVPEDMRKLFTYMGGKIND